MQEGDYRLLLYPLDYAGNLCGMDNGKVDMTGYPYLYYVNDFAGGVCVKVISLLGLCWQLQMRLYQLFLDSCSGMPCHRRKR